MSNDYVYDFHFHHELEQSKETYIKKGLCGLINLGNKCFLNSILQCLSHTLKLTDYFLSKKYMDDDPERHNKKKNEYFLIISYINLLTNLWETNQLIKPKSFVENISKFVSKYFTLEQQDSHECLMYILDYFHKALSYEIEVQIHGEIQTPQDKLMKLSLESWKQTYEKQYSHIINLFNGLFYNKIECINCDVQEDVFEPYNCISLNIPSTTSDLQDCLSNFFVDNEIINTWKCSKCDKEGCKKSCKYWSVPNYLIIHLKRFKNDNSKIHSLVNFPLEDLNLTNYISPDKKDPNNYIYSLYAINYHSGNSNSGHYWSCCKNLDNNWYLFNDGHVTKMHNLNELITKDAYILFYYRKFIKKQPIMV